MQERSNIIIHLIYENMSRVGISPNGPQSITEDLVMDILFFSQIGVVPDIPSLPILFLNDLFSAMSMVNPRYSVFYKKLVYITLKRLFALMPFINPVLSTATVI